MATDFTRSILTSIRDEPHVPRWTKDEYYRMGEAGLFDGRRVELIEGEIVEMSPIGSAHATAVTLVQAELQAVLPRGHFVRVQAPMSIEERSEPEPDLVVIEGAIRDYALAHPTTALLVVEVSDTTLRFDREIKGPLYARAGIEEYWIVNIADRQLEVYRAPGGERYARTIILNVNESIAPLVAPDAAIKVTDLLP